MGVNLIFMKEPIPPVTQLHKVFNRTPEREPTRPPAFRAELEMLQRQLSKRVPTLGLTMGGGLAVAVNREANESIRRRFAYVHERLERNRGKAAKDHARTRG